MDEFQHLALAEFVLVAELLKCGGHGHHRGVVFTRDAFCLFTLEIVGGSGIYIIECGEAVMVKSEFAVIVVKFQVAFGDGGSRNVDHPHGEDGGCQAGGNSIG